MTTPEIKICGLTTVPQLEACIAAGVQAIGLMFYEKSPRFAGLPTARDLGRRCPADIMSIGVFVDAGYDAIMSCAHGCRLGGVQLHGRESGHLVERLQKEGLMVIKALFQQRAPFFDDAGTCPADALLLECGRGPLPGGNASAWQWEAAAPLGLRRPVVLAGGLNPDNVAQAIQAANPWAVDVSSGVETAPGCKDAGLIHRFVRAVRASGGTIRNSGGSSWAPGGDIRTYDGNNHVSEGNTDASEGNTRTPEGNTDASEGNTRTPEGNTRTPGGRTVFTSFSSSQRKRQQ